MLIEFTFSFIIRLHGKKIVSYQVTTVREQLKWRRAVLLFSGYSVFCVNKYSNSKDFRYNQSTFYETYTKLFFLEQFLWFKIYVACNHMSLICWQMEFYVIYCHRYSPHPQLRQRNLLCVEQKTNLYFCFSSHKRYFSAVLKCAYM